MMEFFPALFNAEPGKLPQDLLGLSVCNGGLGIPNLTSTVADNHVASKAATKLLMSFLLGGEPLDANAHVQHVGTTRREGLAS